MKPRLLMTSSALFLGLLGAAASFAPQEIAERVVGTAPTLLLLLLQLLGGAYLGFAILNWMARGVLVGGIYGRPLALGNFLHFAVVALVLAKAWTAGVPGRALLAGAVCSGLWAAWFGATLFTRAPPR